MAEVGSLLPSIKERVLANSRQMHWFYAHLRFIPCKSVFPAQKHCFEPSWPRVAHLFWPKPSKKRVNTIVKKNPMLGLSISVWFITFRRAPLVQLLPGLDLFCAYCMMILIIMFADIFSVYWKLHLHLWNVHNSEAPKPIYIVMPWRPTEGKDWHQLKLLFLFERQWMLRGLQLHYKS